MVDVRLTMPLAGQQLASRATDGGPPDDPIDASCPHCGGELAWHQPDIRRPGRLLGTCSECGGWYLLDESSGSSGACTPISGTIA